jgi:hypothetical protein
VAPTALLHGSKESAICHSREGGNPEKIFLSHPEFISGSTKKMLKRVQHDKKVWIPAFAGMTYYCFY